jgi:hypothetical protein
LRLETERTSDLSAVSNRACGGPPARGARTTRARECRAHLEKSGRRPWGVIVTNVTWAGAKRTTEHAGLAVVALALTVALGAEARAAGPRVGLRVTREVEAADCPDAPALAARVEAIVREHSIAAESDREGTVAFVQFAHKAGGYDVRVLWSGRLTGERTFETTSDNCQPAAEAAAVALALAVDAVPAAAPEPEPKAPPPADSPSPSPDLRSVAEPSRRGSMFRPQISLAAGGTVGLPAPLAPLIRLDVDFHGRHLPIVFGFGVAGNDERTAYSGGSVGLQVATALGRFCFRPLADDSGKYALACAMATVGGLRAFGSGYTQPEQDQWRLFASAGAELEAGMKVLGPVGVQLRAALLFPLVRYRFGVGSSATPDVQEVSRVSPIAGLLAAGVYVRFP